METPTPPDRTDVRFKLDWPPVEIIERQETLGEHIAMAAVMLAATFAFLTMGFTSGAVIVAFIAGVAVSNAVNHYLVYGSGGVE